MPLDPNPLKDILYRTTARYLSVRPQGIALTPQHLVPVISAKILAHGPARTLYRGRKPFCRSLDALRSTDAKACAECLDLKNCTSQLRLHLLVDDRPYCLLLAYTSAKNFLLYVGHLQGDRDHLREFITVISVANRGSWGELRFAKA
jgi:hypothetical protein